MEKVESLYQELQLLVKSEQYEAATHICDRIKLLGCMDSEVLRTKIYCLIQRKMWNQALFLIKTFERDNIELPFEKSYCLYRINNFKDALETLEALGDPTKALSKLENRAISHLKIQILYRLGRFEECERLYSLMEPIITKENNYVELEMLRVNQLAVFSSIHNLNKNVEDFDIPDYLTSSIEYWFNRCCLYLSNNDIDNAMTSLEMSESLYNSLSENYESEDQQSPNPSDECSLILMRAYIMQQIGQNEEARLLYEESFEKFGLDGVKLEPSMVHLGVVAYNNYFLLSKNGNPHSYIDGLKRLSITSKDQIEHKMTINQNFIISLNKALLLYNESGFKQYIKQAEKFSVDNLKLELFKIGLFLLQGKTKKAVQYINFLHNKNQDNIEFSISVLKILLKLKMANNAFKILDSKIDKSISNFHQWTISPELFNELLVLIQNILIEKFSNSAPDMIKQKLKSILNHAISKSTGNKSNSKLPSLLCVLGKHLLMVNLITEAAECFRFVLEDLADSNNDFALSGYVSACTLCGHEVPKFYLRQLDKKLPNSVFSIDAEILEKMEAPTRTSERDNQDSKSMSHVNLTIKTKSKRKKRKPRYPKGFDPINPGQAPDPERWLPKEQRSSFRKLKKNRSSKKGQVEKGGHQGAIPTSSAEIKAAVPSTAKQAALSSSSSTRRSHKKKRR
ncbi:SRP72 RNA-binding domain-containing [Cryptosporidium sp. chipmunk genotype I]|uniref:SRP72 RNA-binding domain-containing n=1 Tax=Cryptosporidium sp. chipmunk genotype I TaxID=1280935 RepID=UPI003519DE0E|nr:SRP72 RNA-binding domain-containing [Cryptosporidium sp. chipmunk genotype I]